MSKRMTSSFTHSLVHTNFTQAASFPRESLQKQRFVPHAALHCLINRFYFIKKDPFFGRRCRTYQVRYGHDFTSEDTQPLDEDLRELYHACRRLLKEASDLGNADSSFFFGTLYEQGLCAAGVDVNYEISAEWYLKGADKGHVGCCYYLGSLYLTGGYGLERNEMHAKVFLSRAACAGDHGAQYVLGSHLRHGEKSGQEEGVRLL